MNPYWGTNFFTFFAKLAGRLSLALQGKLSTTQLASDEVQILVLIAVSCASAAMGAFLVYKRMTMVANSLSHTILLGIVVSYLLMQSSSFFYLVEGFVLNWKIMLLAALISALLTTLLTQALTHLVKLQEDASIGLVFTTLFALSIVLVTLYTRDLHLGTEVIMGNVDALHFDDFKLVSLVALVNLVLVLLFFKQLTMTAFDPALATSLGIPVTLFNYLLMFLTATTAIGAFRAVGVLLFLALLVGPILIARLLTHRLGSLIALAIAIGVGCSLFAVALSRHLLTVYQMPLSTAGLLVTLIGLLYTLLLIGQLVRRRAISNT